MSIVLLSPRRRAILFAVPLVAAIVTLGFLLPETLPLYGSLPLGTGSFSLANPGHYVLGLQYVNRSSPEVRPYTIIERGDHWASFVATVNGSGPFRIRGSWAATEPTMVVIAWNALWTASSTVATVNYGCGGFPGQFCATSLVVTARSGTFDVSIGSQNPLCTDPPDSLGPCVDLGYGMQGMYLGNAAAPNGPAGTGAVSVTFISFEDATVTVVEPFVFLYA